MKRINHTELDEIFNRYNKTSIEIEKIQKTLTESVILYPSEIEELKAHHSIFRNLKNYLLARINDLISETGYSGLKREDSMLDFQIKDEEKLYEKWNKMAFDEGCKPFCDDRRPNPVINGKSHDQWEQELRTKEAKEALEKELKVVEKEPMSGSPRETISPNQINPDFRICSICGHDRVSHRIMDMKCPASNEQSKWKDTNFSPSEIYKTGKKKTIKVEINQEDMVKFSSFEEQENKENSLQEISEKIQSKA